MPVTAKLSKRFYEALGEDVANELVEWFNMVDATYRGDLRELNELNFARIDAKMEQRPAESEGRMERKLSELEARMERRFAKLEGDMERRFAGLHGEMDRRFAERKVETEKESAAIKVLIAEKHEVMLRWLLLCWLTTGGGLLLLKVL